MSQRAVMGDQSPARQYILAATRLPGLKDVDWQKAPGNFKLYRGCEQIPLGYEPLAHQAARVCLSGKHLGQMLSDIYGFTRQCHTIGSLPVPAPDSSSPGRRSRQFVLHRPVASGGALFPCELYLLIGQEKPLPAGLYHYDAVHHALDILRQGDNSAHASACLALPSSLPTFTLLLSCLFWKSGYKYGAFSYRLHSLDIGVVIAQCQAVIARYGLTTCVHYQFLDSAINQLPGLDDLYESIYAVITCTETRRGEQRREHHAPLIQLEPLSFLTEPAAAPGTSLAQWPLLEQLHHASCICSPDSFRRIGRLPAIMPPAALDTVLLPRCSPLPDLLTGLHERRSASGYFWPGTLALQQLADLFLLCTQRYASDLDGNSASLQHTLFYCAVHKVEGLEEGIYYYQPEKHSLELVRAGDVCADIQRLQTNLNFMMNNVNICILQVVCYEDGFQAYGDRWYRIQNMEAGIAIQRLSLAAAALKLECRVSLGFHVQAANALLSLPPDFHCIAEVMIASACSTWCSYEQPLF
jgi:SagB-type dehydrogenase family enzyme